MLCDLQNTSHRKAGVKGVGLLLVLFTALAAFSVAAGLSAGLAGAPLRASDPAYRSDGLKEAPPAEVSESVRKVVAAQGLRVLGPKGKPFVDVWLRKSVPIKADENTLGIDFGSLKDGSLLGVLRFHEKSEDFRDSRVRAGVYTFRYAISPEDGDHQGVADTRDFVLLCPVDLDVKPDPMSTEEVVKLSVKVSRRKHPSTLYLVKMFDKPEKLPRLVHQEDLEYWVLDFQVPVEGKSAKTAVRMGLVLVGLAPEF